MDNQKGLKQVQSALEDRTIEIIDAPILHDIREGRLDLVQWQEFARQRYLAALSFEPLLEAAINKTSIIDPELSDVLKDNWRDEQGINKWGNHSSIGSHEKWRQDFYKALGLRDEDLEEVEPSEGTLEYSSQMHRLTLRGSGLELSGGILMQEYSIPHEFKWLQKGVNQSFPEQFVATANDSSKVRRQKKEAGLYLDHHIRHDGLSHHPRLEAALEKHLDDPDKLIQVLSGIGIVAQARKRFFQSFGGEAIWE